MATLQSVAEVGTYAEAFAPQTLLRAACQVLRKDFKWHEDRSGASKKKMGRRPYIMIGKDVNPEALGELGKLPEDPPLMMSETDPFVEGDELLPADDAEQLAEDADSEAEHGDDKSDSYEDLEKMLDSIDTSNLLEGIKASAAQYDADTAAELAQGASAESPGTFGPDEMLFQDDDLLLVRYGGKAEAPAAGARRTISTTTHVTDSVAGSQPQHQQQQQVPSPPRGSSSRPFAQGKSKASKRKAHDNDDDDDGDDDGDDDEEAQELEKKEAERPKKRLRKRQPES